MKSVWQWKTQPVFTKNQPPLDKEYEAAQSNRHGIGALLQASRLRCGEDLHEVARMLRIRYLYLEAIEEDRFHDLPGLTYAIGFIRTYADHLGLDSEEVVRRFKAEAESKGAKPKSDLFFPIPLSESEIPGGAILFMAVLAAVLTYGGWYVSSSKNGFFAELVSPVPNHLNAPPAEEENGKAENLSSSGSSIAEAPSPQFTSSSQETTDASNIGVASEVVSNETTPLTESAESAKPLTEPEPISSQAAASPMVPAVKAPEIEAPTIKISAPEAPSADTAAVTKSNPSAAAEEIPVTEPQLAALPGNKSPTTEENVYGAKEGASRIMVRAVKSSWIQVRDDNSKQLLLTRLLKGGDSYRVPDRPGLRLLTGDAGALEILIDGKPAPSIGGAGTVRRNVALDVDRLREGKAVVE